MRRRRLGELGRRETISALVNCVASRNHFHDAAAVEMHAREGSNAPRRIH